MAHQELLPNRRNNFPSQLSPKAVVSILPCFQFSSSNSSKWILPRAPQVSQHTWRLLFLGFVKTRAPWQWKRKKIVYMSHGPYLQQTVFTLSLTLLNTMLKERRSPIFPSWPHVSWSPCLGWIAWLGDFCYSIHWGHNDYFRSVHIYKYSNLCGFTRFKFSDDIYRIRCLHEALRSTEKRKGVDIREFDCMRLYAVVTLFAV